MTGEREAQLEEWGGGWRDDERLSSWRGQTTESIDG